MASAEKIIVIGAGMAGLTAAHYLKEAGYEVIVVERDNRPGGRMQSVMRNGDIIDVGAQFTHTNYKSTMELVKKYGLESDMVEMKTSNMQMRGEKTHIIHWNQIRMSAISLWSNFLSTRLLKMMVSRRKDLTLEAWPELLDLDKLELSTFVRLRLNQEYLDYIVRPLMLSYSMSEPEGISLAYFMRCFHMYLMTGAHCFKSGNDILAKKMAHNLEVRYETEVKKILCDREGNITGAETSDGTIEGSAVISAIPSPELFPLYSNWNSEQRGFLREFTFRKLPVVTMEGKVGEEVTFYGGILDRNAGHKTSFICVPHRKYNSEVSPNYIQAWPMGDFGDDLVGLPDEKIIEAVTEDLRKWRPKDIESIESAFVTWHLNQFPQFKMGMFEKLLKFLNTEGSPSGLYFAGDYTEGGLIEGAVVSGCKTAHKIINK